MCTNNNKENYKFNNNKSINLKKFKTIESRKEKSFY